MISIYLLNNYLYYLRYPIQKNFNYYLIFLNFIVIIITIIKIIINLKYFMITNIINLNYFISIID